MTQTAALSFWTDSWILSSHESPQNELSYPMWNTTQTGSTEQYNV